MLPDETRTFTAAYKRAVTLLLMSAYAFNAMDRSIIAIVNQAIKRDLSLTDTELGLLGGTAFGLFHALGGIPIARLAERFNRVNIIACAMVAWSVLCALCGAAAAFPQLLVTRVGVGIAESGCTPAAHSLLSDYYPPAERTSALSIYSCGISLGYLLAAVVGSYVAQALGLAGRLRGRRPSRHPHGGRAQAHHPRAARRAAAPTRHDIRRGLVAPRARRAPRSRPGDAGMLAPPVRHMILGLTIGGFAAYGFYAFVPAFFMRAYGLGIGRAGVLAGLAGGVAVGAGIAAGGPPRRFAGAPAIPAGMRWCPPWARCSPSRSSGWPCPRAGGSRP